MRDEARWLGVGFVNLLHLYSPAVIVVGGGLASTWEMMRPEIERTVRTRAMPAYRDVPVVPSALGPRAGVVGAASLLLAGRR
jgi:glucokinase